MIAAQAIRARTPLPHADADFDFDFDFLAHHSELTVVPTDGAQTP